MAYAWVVTMQPYGAAVILACHSKRGAVCMGRWWIILLMMVGRSCEKIGQDVKMSAALANTGISRIAALHVIIGLLVLMKLCYRCVHLRRPSDATMTTTVLTNKPHDDDR